uniref:Uncharacterized protein n=1 Tax=Anguilla anguilla TaxID=7936 RepID=A0A0E9SFC9_ANGAN
MKFQAGNRMNIAWEYVQSIDRDSLHAGVKLAWVIKPRFHSMILYLTDTLPLI